MTDEETKAAVARLVRIALTFNAGPKDITRLLFATFDIQVKESA